MNSTLLILYISIYLLIKIFRFILHFSFHLSELYLKYQWFLFLKENKYLQHYFVVHKVQHDCVNSIIDNKLVKYYNYITSTEAWHCFRNSHCLKLTAA